MSAAPAAPPPPRALFTVPGQRRFTWSALKAKLIQDPFVFGFFGLTCAALGRGLLAMLANDRRGSQRMMRFRVGFQLAAIGALVGGMYYRALTGQLPVVAAPAAAAADAPEAEAEGRALR